MARILGPLLLCLAGAALAQDVVLAPGRSVTLLDASDPSMRVVISAPPEAPLDLSELLRADPKEDIRAVVTRIQLRQARGIAANADGSISLSRGPLPPPPQRATMLEGGVIVHDAGRYAVYPAKPAATATGAPASAPSSGAGGERQRIARPGATREQTERDLRQCRLYAESAAGHFVTRTHRAAMHNMAMASCLRGFGYDIGPAPN